MLIAADLDLTVSPELQPYVQSVQPASYDNLLLPHDPLLEVCVPFVVRLKGPPCGASFAATGTLTVLLNGTPLDIKPLSVVQPACFSELGLMLVGMRRLDPPVPLPGGDPADLLLVDAQILAVILPLGVLPVFDVPDVPGIAGLELYFQCAFKKPGAFPDDPLKTSNGLKVIFGDPNPGEPYSTGSGLTLFMDGPALVPGQLALECVLF